MSTPQKILIIDDNADLRANNRTILESHGYNVFEAADGENGLKKVKQVNPDLILLDVMMNNLTEGFNVAQQLRSPAETSPYKDYKTIPIIIITSIHKKYDFHFDHNVGSEWLPVDSFMDKPVSPDELVKKVEDVLKKSKK